jgi:tetratricopeptide (TPR) repeat protein
VQVSPVLVRVADGTTKWAGEPTVVTPSDPFAAQSALATEVAEALDVALAPAERVRLARPPTADTAAFAAVERGWRMLINASTQADRVLALREFERAYQRDPQYADAFGKAAEVLLWMVWYGAPQAYYDSAAVLARRALALDPSQTEAVSTLARFELHRGRPDEGLRLIERAARAFPSSPSLQNLLASARYQTFGDSAGAVDAVSRAVALAPRSREIVFMAMYAALELRRYDDARDLLARAHALEPEWLGVPTMAADLATAVGDTAGVSAAMRALRAAGQGAHMLDQMRSGDDALQQELAAVSLASLGAATPVVSERYYRVKAQLFLTRGEGAKARALVDSGYRLVASHAATLPAGANDAPDWWRRVAWYAAARRDRPAAVAALRQSAADPLIAGHPGSQADAHQTCTSAEVYGLLGDAEAMLPLLRRCLTMPNGYHLAQLGEPAFMRLRADPRVRTLAAEISAAQARARARGRIGPTP